MKYGRAHRLPAWLGLSLVLSCAGRDDAGERETQAPGGGAAGADPVQRELRKADRERMVAEQIEARGVSDPGVLEALRRVPREAFVPENQRAVAYRDGALPIGEGQTISQPFVVAAMTEALALEQDSRVLEVGTGSGYQAAVLAEISRDVRSIEIIPELAARARQALDSAGYGAVKTRVGDGWRGWPEAAPFDAIIVTAAPGFVPPELVEQLAVGGRLCIPVGGVGEPQELRLLEKQADGSLHERRLFSVAFVPMTGGDGQAR